MSVQAITSLSQFRQLIESPTPIVVDFWATSCGNCKALAPFYNSLASAASPATAFYAVEIYDQPNIPTFMVFKDGNKITELVGAYPQRLKELVDSLTG